MVRVVFRPYTRVGRAICTSAKENPDTSDQSASEEEQFDDYDDDGTWASDSSDEEYQDLGLISGLKATAVVAQEEMKTLKDPKIATLRSENSGLRSHRKEEDAEIAKLCADVDKLIRLISERKP